MNQPFILRDEAIRSRSLDFIRKLRLDTLWQVVICEYVPNKTREQEEKYHAMIGEIAKQCCLVDRKLDRETWKRLLVEQFVQEQRQDAIAEGGLDPFPASAQLMPSIDRKRLVQLGVQTRRFKRKQAAEFIEFLYAFGAEHEVRFTERERMAA